MARKKASAIEPVRDTSGPIAEPLKLRDLRLLECMAKQNDQSLTSRKPAEKLQLRMQLSAEFGSQAVAKIRATFDLNDQENPDEFHLQAVFYADFQGLSADDPDRTQRTAVRIIWPYWREFVQTMTTRMGLPPLRVPIIFPDKLKMDAADGEETTGPPRKKKAKKKSAKT